MYATKGRRNPMWRNRPRPLRQKIVHLQQVHSGGRYDARMDRSGMTVLCSLVFALGVLMLCAYVGFALVTVLIKGQENSADVYT